MTIDERTITRALRTYAQGLDLTDTDLDRLESRLDERLHGDLNQNGSRRRWEWAVAACAVVALILATTALWRTRAPEALPAMPPPTTITAADLVGAWLSEVEDSNGWIWYFTDDAGLVRSSLAADLFTGEMAEPEATFTLGPGNVMDVAENGIPCRATAHLTPDGRLTLTPVNGQNLCELFDDGLVHPFVRVSPASLAGMAMVTSPWRWMERPARRAVSMVDLSGTWLLRGSGTILVIDGDPSSQYALDDDGGGAADPDQQGSAILRPDGGLVLRPSGTPCDTVYSRVVTTGTQLEAELDDASCGRIGGVRDTWIRLN